MSDSVWYIGGVFVLYIGSALLVRCVVRIRKRRTSCNKNGRC